MTMSAREKAIIAAAQPTDQEPMEWNADEEIQLFFALDGLKPVGVNKHFYMACITDRLSKSLNRDVPAEAIWAHLRTIYNLEMLDELEPLPFPNEEKEFSLPDTEFSALLSKKRAESEEKVIDISAVLPSTTTTLTMTEIMGKDKTVAGPVKTTSSHPQTKEMDKKLTKLLEMPPKRTPKRTRGSMSLESNSPSTTPPPVQSNKRRRI